MNPPKVIFFDAVGTLFGVRGSVGEAYAQLAKRFGVDVDDRLLDKAFLESFRAAPQAAFPGVERTQLPRYEFEWWKAIATDTFKRAGVFDNFVDFATFFTEIYDYFATSEPWLIYHEVFPTLERLYSSGIELGILSNFDSRLYSVLEALDLADFFSSVTISTEAGAAKPDPKIFQVGLKKHRCDPAQAWHIGDSYQEDYEGAIAVGIRAIWLNREK